jgi:hypothetical protein
MWATLVAAAAAAMASMWNNHQQSIRMERAQQRARHEKEAEIRMQMAQRMSPDMPTYGMEAAQFNNQQADQRDAFNGQMDDQKRQMYAQVLPLAVSAFGNNLAESNPTAGADAKTGSMLDQWRAQDDVDAPWMKNDTSKWDWS